MLFRPRSCGGFRNVCREGLREGGRCRSPDWITRVNELLKTSPREQPRRLPRAYQPDTINSVLRLWVGQRGYAVLAALRPNGPLPRGHWCSSKELPATK